MSFSNLFLSVLNVVGASMRFMYGSFIRFMGYTSRPTYSFKEYLHGSQRKEDERWDEKVGHHLLNQLVGFLTILLLVYAMKRLNHLFP